MRHVLLIPAAVRPLASGMGSVNAVRVTVTSRRDIPVIFTA